MKWPALLVFALSWSLSLAADIDVKAQTEIGYLLNQMQHSKCRFGRNGSWYDADEAVFHIDRKYQYLLKRNAIRSAENFIGHAASRSSTSGQPYRVQCGESAVVESAEWFRAELDMFRRRHESSH
jgi:hypothetical protein